MNLSPRWQRSFLVLTAVLAVVLAVGEKSLALDFDAAQVDRRNERILNDLRSQLHKTSPPSEQAVIARVPIEVIDDPREGAMAVVTTDNQGKIIISKLFLARITIAADAMTYETMLEISNVTREYLKYRDRSEDYPGRPPKSIAEFVRLTPEDVAEVESKTGLQMFRMFYLSALAMTLSHEYGHHVTGGFYDPLTPKDEILEIEKKADAWAFKAMRRADMPPMFGMYVLGHILMLKDHPENRSDNQRTHPLGLERLLESLSGSEAEIRDHYRRLIQLSGAGSAKQESFVNNAMKIHRQNQKEVAGHLRDVKERTGAWYYREVRGMEVKDMRSRQRLADYAYRGAHMHLKGIRCQQDDTKAYQMFRVAARLGHERGLVWWAHMNYKGWGCEVDKELAMEVLNDLSSDGHAFAIFVRRCLIAGI